MPDFFRALFDGNPIPMWIFNPQDLAILEANQSALNLFGYSKDEFLNLCSNDLCMVQHQDSPESDSSERTPLETHSFRAVHRTREGQQLIVEEMQQGMVWQNVPAVLVMVLRVLSPLLEPQMPFLPSGHALLNHLPDAVLVVSKEGVVEFANIDLPGHPRDEILGTSIFRYIDSQDKETVKQVFHSVFNGAETGQFQAACAGPSEKPCWIWGRIRKLPSTGGQEKALLLLTDVSELKQVENELQLFRNLIEQSNDSFFIIQPGDGRILDVNEKACADLGYSKKAMLQKKIAEVVQLPLKTSWKQITERLMREESLMLETSHICIDKSSLPVEISLKHIVLSGIDYFVAISRDIRERKVVEAELQEARANISAIIESSNDAIWSVDRNFNLTHGNTVFFEGFQSYCKKRPEIGRPIFEFLPPDLMKEFFDQWINWYKRSFRGQRFSVEKTYTVGDREHHFLISFSPKIVNGKINGAAVFLKDITQLKQAETSLRSSVEKWRALVGNSPDFIYTLQQDGTILAINRPLPGIPREKIVGESIYNFIPHEIKDMLQSILKDVFSNAIPISDEIAGIGPDGEVGWYLMRVIPILDDGMVREAILINSDITERKQLEAELQETLEHLEAIYSASPDMIFLHDEQGRLLEVNENVLTVYGITREELQRIDPRELMGNGYTLEMALEKIRLALKKGKADFEWVARKKNGQQFPVEVRLRRVELRTEDGKLKPHILAIVRDITQRKKTERALKTSEEKYRLLVENQTDLLVKVDLQGRFQFVSPSYCELFGKTERELLGKHFMPLVHEDDREKTARAMENLFRPPYECYVEQRALTRHGWRWLAWADKSIVDENNNVVGIVGVGRDITDRKKAEEETLKRIHQLQALGKAVEMLTSTIELEPLLEKILEAAIKAIPGAEKGSILLFDEGTRKLKIRALSGYSDPRIRFSEFPLASGYSARAIREKRPLLIPDAHKDPAVRYDGDIEEIMEIKSAVVAPLMVKDKIIGAIALDSARRKAAFDKADLQLLVSFAAPAAAAIENARLHDSLKESESRYRTLVEEAPEGILVLDVDRGVFSEINENAAHLFGYSREELASMGPLELSPEIQPDGRLSARVLEEKILLALNQEMPVFEWTFLKASGQPFPCEVRLVKFPGGKRNLVRGSIFDISERKKTEQQIHSYNERLKIFQSIDRAILSARSLKEIVRAAVQNLHKLIPFTRASVLIFDWGKNTVQLLKVSGKDFNKTLKPQILSLDAFSNMPNLKKKQIITVRDLAKSNLKSPLRKILEKENVRSFFSIPLLAKEELIATFNIGYARPDGFTPEQITVAQEVAEQLTVAIHQNLLMEKIQSYADALEQRVQERTRDLSESESRYRQLVENPLVGIYQADADARIVYVNPRLVSLTGYSLEEIRGKTLVDFVAPHQKEWIAERLRTRREGKLPADTIEVELIRKDGSALTALVAPASLMDADGNFIGYIGALIDITQKKELEKQLAGKLENLEHITEKLERANTELEAFAYTVSHDLRAPLRAMYGFAQALKEDYYQVLEEEGRSYTERIIKAAERMEALIQDLLAYSRIGRAEVNFQAVHPLQVLNSVLSQLESEIQSKNAVVHLQGDFPSVRANAQILSQVFFNLLHNAIKFVYPGKQPRITVWAEPRHSKVRIWIQDNGVGIAPEYRERIFRVFERLYPIETFPGTGIGLAIVRKAMERMSGRVGVESEPEKGSRFWVELPVAENLP